MFLTGPVVYLFSERYRPLAQAASSKATNPRTPGKPPGKPPATPRGSSRDTTAAQQHIVSNIELKHRNQELEGMARSYEELNCQLTQQKGRLESDKLDQTNAMDALRIELQSANSRAAAEGSRADGETARADAAAANAARALESENAAAANAARALESEGRARAETESAVIEMEEAQARAEAAQGAFARSESALADTQAANDRASARASACAFAEIAQAKNEVSKGREALVKAEELASKTQQENSVLRSALDALARQVRGETTPTKAGKRRGRGAAAAAAAAFRGTGGVVGGEGSGGDELGLGVSCRDGDDAERLLKFMTGFCGLVLSATARELPLDVLQKFLAPAAASHDERKQDGGTRSDDKSPQFTGEGLAPREDVSVKQEEPTVASSTCCVVSSPPVAVAPATAAAIPGETYRAINPRRELLKARNAQKEREAKRIAEEKERERAERVRDAREKRQRAARQTAASQAHNAGSPESRQQQWVSSPQFLQSRQQQQQQQGGGGDAGDAERKRVKHSKNSCKRRRTLLRCPALAATATATATATVAVANVEPSTSRLPSLLLLRSDRLLCTRHGLVPPFRPNEG